MLRDVGLQDDTSFVRWQNVRAVSRYLCAPATPNEMVETIAEGPSKRVFWICFLILPRGLESIPRNGYHDQEHCCVLRRFQNT